jgi:hypothetical protein
MYEELGFDGISRMVGDLRDLDYQDRLRKRNDNNIATTNEGLDREFIANMWKILDGAGNLLLDKHKDYGPTNISNAPGGPLNGLRVRMHDKTARINHLLDTGAEPTNESLKDSFVDLLNYSAIAIMVLEGTWPK